MTEPTEQDDLTDTDDQVEATDNGLRPDDPLVQPPQDPEALPPGTVSEVHK
jgi:hypothetical protein